MIERLRAKRKKTGGDQLVIGWLAFPSTKQVAGDLFADKLLEGLVVVERADDVVTVSPSVRVGEVALHPIGFAVARDVEPVASPVLAEVRRSE